LEACEAVFNVQRLVAFEGGVKEAEKKLEEFKVIALSVGERDVEGLNNSMDSLVGFEGGWF